MTANYLTALPVYNEADYVDAVLDQVKAFSPEVLVVDDGSTDPTSRLLAARDDVRVVTHARNLGYGAALITAFDYAVRHGFEFVVTVDCDGQHEPRRIQSFVAACHDADIVSGSRYLEPLDLAGRAPPEQRRRINAQVTAELNRRLGLNLTDAFCGFKAYRVDALRRLCVAEPGYAMPLELWVQAAHAGLRIKELPVPLIYLDASRSFGGALDDSATRYAYYRLVLDRSIAACQPAGSVRCTDAGYQEGVG